jgi:hypothetical protein
MSHLLPLRRDWLTVAMVLGLGWSSYTAAQTVSEYEVKAAYIYNLAKFVEWPARSFRNASAPMRFCVLQDRFFEVELDGIVRGKSIAGRPIEVVLVRDADQSRNCQILFIHSAQNREIRYIAEVLREAGVLTIGESEGFLEEGGMINFVLQDRRIQLEVNHRAANESGLYVSSRLLKVARRVIE